MRILNIVIAKIWGGGEQYVYDTAKAMKKHNVDVYIAVDISNVQMQKKFSEVATVITFNLYGMAGMKAIFPMKRFIEERNIEIINCHNGHSMPLCLILKLITDIKLVMFKHNAIPGKNDFYHKWQREKTDAFVCVSDLVYRMQTENLNQYDEKKYHLIYNGIDIEKFNQSSDEEAQKKDGFTIGYAGRITYNKGIEILINAVEVLRLRYPNIQLLLAGSDDKGYLKEVNRLVLEKNLMQCVKYLGHIDNMESFYKELNIFVLPSVVKEAFGLVICEAMYCETVVVSTDSGAQKEIIDDNVDGYIIKSNDVVALVECLENIYLYYNEHNLLKKLARKKIAEKFSIDVCINKILDLYTSLK